MPRQIERARGYRGGVKKDEKVEKRTKEGRRRTRGGALVEGKEYTGGNM